MKLASIPFIVLAAGMVMAQSPTTPPQPHIVFSVANPRVEPSQYTLEIRQDGTGEYKATYTASGMDSAAAPADRAIRVQDPVLAEIFSAARKYNFFATDCQEPHGHVAFTGKKTLSYIGPDGKGSCTFNYSREKGIDQTATNLMSVAYTLEVGARLASEHRYDRLSLDAELKALQEAVADRSALEIENIAPVLESIANDDAVMNLARARAQKLLNEATTTR